MAVVRVDQTKSKALIQKDLNKISKDLKINIGLNSKNLSETNKGLNTVATNTKKVNANLKESVFTMEDFKSEIRTAIVRTIEWNVAMTAVLGTVKKLKDAMEFIVEIDTGLTEIAMVTGRTREEVAYLGDSYLRLAEELKVSTTEITKKLKPWPLAFP